MLHAGNELQAQSRTDTHLPKYYNTTEVHNTWKDCIQYNVDFKDPAYDHIESLYLDNISTMKTNIERQKKKVQKGQFYLLPINFTEFDRSSHDKQKELAVSFSHEVRMFQLTHRRCYKCQGVSIVKEYSNIRNEPNTFQCTQCKKSQICNFYKYDSDMMLPVWYDENNKAQFNVPTELQNLRLGEQLLIQRLSCFIPIVHIKHGIMGIHGNCVCFRQDITEICNILPRTRVNAIKIIKSYTSKDCNGIQDCDVFMIRRDVVLKALKWLKVYHKWYREDPDVIINESNLDWMQGKCEASLIGSEAETSNNCESVEFDSPMHEQDETNQIGKSLCYKFFS